ncbi:MAG: aminotransferase class III-fold pyridoxal phosphate-dependent enzyme [Saprospiraceae bacterium]|nr:aminotransferase class III-fold pyridoxal phosphate-dependent enzyme [Saprospiraceae bacterium]MBX7178255.1 aminotransferase class III-fold pyridoxal phosphate-dependent enzyme [Saprospiraceae bacterium]MCB0590696.1 aminotransferase class III-fold pyridoxal phosphate-dependent enzyme [Saprospiraceae bacterium]MCO5283449.1 aminotransferase class III-fold pyridoxal phosphate-dependent enzyme [Saprospiraceae bacterium]MCO6469997.1 aminotransferase class III-fold pyridoxal phosphate-dependent en
MPNSKSIWTTSKNESQSVIDSAVEGDRVYVTTDKNNNFIDATSIYGTSILGYGNKKIAHAIFDQLMKLEEVDTAWFNHNIIGTLATDLLSKGGMPNGKVNFFQDRFLALEAIICMAIRYQYTSGKERSKLMVWSNSTFTNKLKSSILMASALPKYIPENQLPEIVTIPLPSSPDDMEAFNEIEILLQKEEIAAFIYEPLIQCDRYMTVYSKEVLSKTLELTKKYEVLNIADETISGIYRSGKFFASDWAEIKPDIIIAGNGLTGAINAPVFTIFTDRIFKSLNDDEIILSVLKMLNRPINLIGCVAAISTLEQTNEKDFTDNLNQIISIIKAKTLSYSTAYPQLKARSIGTIFALDIPDETIGQSTPDSIADYFYERNVLLQPRENVLSVMVPLTITSEELYYIFEKIDDFLIETGLK